MNHDGHVCKDKIWRRQNTCIVNIQNVGKPEIVICFVSALMDWWALRLPNYDGRKKEKSKTFWCELNFKVKETQMFLSMIQVLQSWNAANVQHYRLDGGNVTNPRFLFFSQCGFNHCCVVRYYNVTQKIYLISRREITCNVLLRDCHSISNSGCCWDWSSSSTVLLQKNWIYSLFFFCLYCCVGDLQQGKKGMIVFHGGQLESVAIASNYVG